METEEDSASVKAMSTLNIARRRSLSTFVTMSEHFGEQWDFYAFLNASPLQSDRIGKLKRQFYQRIPDFYWCENLLLIHKPTACAIAIYTDVNNQEVFLLIQLPDIIKLMMRHRGVEYIVRQHVEQPILAKVSGLTPLSLNYWDDTVITFSQT